MRTLLFRVLLFFFNPPSPTEIYTLSLHDALPISAAIRVLTRSAQKDKAGTLADLTPEAIHRIAKEAGPNSERSEEHTSELQSLRHLVCRLLLEKKKKKKQIKIVTKDINVC